jgi:hypothetical protein
MRTADPGRTGALPPRKAGDHPGWLLGLLGLLAWQGWLTLSLFGPDRPLDRLLDDRPVLSGRHPLHLYHGYLGARSLYERGTLSCYDPAFHAGYPKTPVFDGSSHPAEVVLALVGGHYCPAAYKVGLAALCAAVPWLLFTAARGVGLSRLACCLACLLGLLVWWGQPCRDALEAGDIDLLLATLLVLAQVGLLIRYHHAPGPLSLLGVVTTSLMGWFAQPLLFALLLPLFLVYYLSVGTRHRLAWHVALLGGLAVAAGANAFWLADWVEYWWIREPLRPDTPLLAHRTFHTLWDAPLWGCPVDRAVAVGLVVAAALGVLLYNEGRQRATARLLGLGWGGLLVLAVGGIAHESLARLGTAHLLVPALLFAALPAAHALTEVAGLARRRAGSAWGGAAAAAALLAAAGAAAPPDLPAWSARLAVARPLVVGFTPDQEALLEAIRTRTSEKGRILWEDCPAPRTASHWTALLPLLTGRAYVGGLDPDAGIEHAAGGLTDVALAGQPLGRWADKDLQDYCRRYNIGWVVCRSPETCCRFRRWAGQGADAPPVALGGEEGACLFTVPGPRSYALTGSANFLQADSRRIVLADVVPQHADGKGEVVLSLHYQSGMRVSPSRVHLEPAETYSPDPIPFVRLCLDEHATRVTITWDKR